MCACHDDVSRGRVLFVAHWVCVLCVCLGVGITAVEGVALPFSASVVLANATEGRAGYNVTSSFAASVELAFNEATSWPTPPKTMTHNFAPDVVVTFAAWVSGTTADADAAQQQLRAYFDTWRTRGNVNVSARLTQLALQAIGRQPAVVTPTAVCSFYTDTITPLAPTACLRNLTVSIFTPLVTDGAVLRELLCVILPTTCDFVVLESVTRTSVHSPISGQITPHTRLDYRVYARDRNMALVTLLQYVQYASALSAQQITYILVNGAQVYYRGNYTQVTVEGSIADCISHYWYLIFLIFVVLILMVLSQRCYYVGRASGRRSARKMEQEIRAGQHMATMLQSSYGAYAPPLPLPPGGTFAYNYVPPAYEQSALGQGSTAMYQPPGSWVPARE